MSRLEGRLMKLEKVGGYVQPLVISYIEGEKTEAEAVAEWEAVNGPVGNREPMFIIYRPVSPSDNPRPKGRS
jgi:hypothetical protein